MTVSSSTCTQRGPFFFLLFLRVGWDWVHLVRRPLFGLLYQSWMMNDDKFGVVGGTIAEENEVIGKKPASVPLCPPQISHYLTWSRNRAAVVGSRRPTAWATARPFKEDFLWTKSTVDLGDRSARAGLIFVNPLHIHLIELPDNRRLRRHLPNDLPIRFLM
jgi:hypothetical protein